MYKRKDGYLRLVTLLVFRLVERIEKYAAGAEHLNRPLCVRMTYISNVLVQLLLHSVWKSPKNVSFRKYFVSAEYLKKMFQTKQFWIYLFQLKQYWKLSNTVNWCNSVFWTPRQICIFHLFSSSSSWNTRFCKMSTSYTSLYPSSFRYLQTTNLKNSCQACRQVLLNQTYDYCLKLFYFDVLTL